MKRILLLGCAYWVMTVASAQDSPVLMRVNGREILRSEFEFAYHHRDAAEYPANAVCSPKEYASLYALSELKADAAKAVGIDTTAAFRLQHEKHREALFASCLIRKLWPDSSICSGDQKNVEGDTCTTRIQVMQIFRRLPQNITPLHLATEKERMDSIYRVMQYQPDMDFSRLVETYSDDKCIRWIERLETTIEFEKVAFSLPDGAVSPPFFTPEGIHILKVIAREDAPVLETTYDSLADRLRCCLASDIATVYARLKEMWHYTPNLPAMRELLANRQTEQVLFTIEEQPYTSVMFEHFAFSRPQAVKRQLDGFIVKSLCDYTYRHMDKICPEICYALRESDKKYLIEEITRQKVDSLAIHDRVGLATYFKFHSSAYRWERPRYKGIVLHCADKQTLRQAKKMLKKLPEKEWVDKLRQTFNTSGEEKIQVEQGVFADGDNKYIDKLVFKKGFFEPVMSYPFTAVAGRKMKRPDDYREVLEQVRKDYRSYLYTSWTRELQLHGKVEINQEVLKTVNNN